MTPLSPPPSLPTYLCAERAGGAVHGQAPQEEPRLARFLHHHPGRGREGERGDKDRVNDAWKHSKGGLTASLLASLPLSLPPSLSLSLLVVLELLPGLSMRQESHGR